LSADVGHPAPAPEQAPAAVTRAAEAGASPVATAKSRRNYGLLVLGIIGIVLLSLVMLFVVAFLILGLGPGAFVFGGILALVPLTIVLIGVSWIDRWEPEPKGNVAFAFLWGAGLAVLIALIVGAEVDNVVNTLGGPGPGYDFFGAVIQAPIVEEGGKGLGLLVIFLAARKHFDGPVDGVVYAAWVAGGFAFTENILYFGSQIVDSGGFNADVAHIFFIRGIMSPFAHVMFTSCTGIALGLAARRTGTIGGIGAFLVGLIPAMMLHALWNGALYFVTDFYGYYVLVQVPLFICAILLVRYFRRKEARLTYDRLSEYAAAGWYGPGELASLATAHGRSQAMAWARQRGLAKTMRNYIRDSTRLALTRQRLNTGRAARGAQADEAALLTSIVSLRAILQGSLKRSG
jgi:protease PrsW